MASCPSHHAGIDSIDAIAALGVPTRRRLYEYVVSREEPVGRDEAAAALAIGRPLVAFHLDRLARAGLLEVAYRRLSGREGPGAGRPAKLYRRAATAVEISLPARRYALAAGLFATALERAGRAGSDQQRGVLLDAARAAGDQLGRGRATLAEALDAGGFEPAPAAPEGPGQVIRLRNCPFGELLSEHRELTCSMNRAFLEGVLAGTGERGWTAGPESEPGFCCVAFRPAAAAS